jgi:hypothetical protein
MKMRFYIHTLSIATCMWMASAVAAQDPPDPDIEQCRRDLDDCVIAAQTPADIEVCSAQEARCIAGEMQVPVPDDVPVDSLIKCTYTAAECTLKALSVDSLGSCTWALEQCIDAALHAQFSCIDKFTQCVADDPLLLPICSLELLVCTD